MRVFTSLKAERIVSIEYPLAPVPPEKPKPVPVVEGAKPVEPVVPVVEPLPEPDKSESVIISFDHNETIELPKADLLLNPVVTERKDTAGKETGPLKGDWLVQDYDIENDEVISKVYDDLTFTKYFKASLSG